MTTPDSSARPPMTDPHAGARAERLLLRVETTPCIECGKQLTAREQFTAEDIDSGERWIVCAECGSTMDAEARKELEGRNSARGLLSLETE